MRALRAQAPGENNVKLVALTEPDGLRSGEVLIQTRAVGVCGSDIHAWHGTQSYPMRYPVTLGHEATGVVAALGPDVTGLTVGQRVVSETARTVCGICQQCREGRYNLCQSRLGFGALYDGAMADFFVSRRELLHEVPTSVPDEVAAITEPYCVAYNATVERARVRPGDSVSIVGSGPIGLFAAEMALLCGASSVLVVGIDGDESRLAQAKEVGATTLLASSREAETGELAWWHRSKFNSRSDVVIDAAGVSATLEAALEVVKPGGQVVKVGWGPEPYNQPLDTLVAKAVELHGSFSHTWTTWERVLRLLGEGRLRAGRYTQACDVSEWEKAFEAMSSRRLVKSVITFS